MNEYRQPAEAIIAAVGGKENIAAATHCATRLRMVLKDENKIDKAAINAIPLAKGNFLTAGQFQIILGTGTVNKVTAELLDITGVKQVSTQEAKDLGAAKGNLVQRFVKTLSDIFVPIIPAIVAGGLLMGLNNVLTAHDLIIKGKTLIEAYPQWAGLAEMINTFANAPFVFLPILIAFSATRIFGGNPFLGAVLGMIMVHPDLTNNYALAKAIEEGTLQHSLSSSPHYSPSPSLARSLAMPVSPSPMPCNGCTTPPVSSAEPSSAPSTHLWSSPACTTALSRSKPSSSPTSPKPAAPSSSPSQR